MNTDIGTAIRYNVCSRDVAKFETNNSMIITSQKEAMRLPFFEHIPIVNYEKDVLLIKFMDISKIPTESRMMRIIIDMVEDYYGLSILKGGRKEEFVKARQFVAYFTRREYNGKVSYPSIGRALQQDHSTVIHSEGVIQDMIDTKDIKYYRDFLNLRTLIKSAIRKKYEQSN